MDLVSSAFRIAFRDFCSDNLVLRNIREIFEGTGIEQAQLSPEKASFITGQRRTLVEEYFASVDWSKVKDVEKFLKVLTTLFTLYIPDDHILREKIKNEGFIIRGDVVSFSSKINTNREIKYLIFAANGYKPEIVITDTLNYEIEIVRNKEYCLIYNRLILKDGLLWKDLIDWWHVFLLS